MCYFVLVFRYTRKGLYVFTSFPKTGSGLPPPAFPLLYYNTHSFVAYGLEFISNGVVNLNPIIEYDLSCKIVYTIVIITEQLSAFTLLLFSIERLVVVYFPLRAKSWLSFKKTCIASAVVSRFRRIFAGTT